jgi:hypothetical protein
MLCESIFLTNPTVLINCTHAPLMLTDLMQVNEIHFLSNMTNIPSILLVLIFTSSQGASYSTKCLETVLRQTIVDT